MMPILLTFMAELSPPSTTDDPLLQARPIDTTPATTSGSREDNPIEIPLTDVTVVSTAAATATPAARPRSLLCASFYTDAEEGKGRLLASLLPDLQQQEHTRDRDTAAASAGDYATHQFSGSGAWEQLSASSATTLPPSKTPMMGGASTTSTSASSRSGVCGSVRIELESVPLCVERDRIVEGLGQMATWRECDRTADAFGVLSQFFVRGGGTKWVQRERVEEYTGGLVRWEVPR